MIFRSPRQQMRGVRPPAVAGLFYPDERGQLSRMVDRMLLDADPDEGAGTLKALVAPHAGYPYSGPIAGSSFEPLRAGSSGVERVVILGPSHRVAFRGIALPAADCFETPLGRVEVDVGAAESLLDLDAVLVDAAPHRQEHGIEVEIPFLQQVLGDFRIVPLVVGQAEPEEVAEVLERLWGGDETRIVISSDLSHFLTYEGARKIDGATARDVVDLRPTLTPAQACGATPLNGLLLRARELGLRARLLDLRSSGDTAGGRDRVVGYGAFTFRPAGEVS